MEKIKCRAHKNMRKLFSDQVITGKYLTHYSSSDLKEEPEGWKNFYVQVNEKLFVQMNFNLSELVTQLIKTQRNHNANTLQCKINSNFPHHQLQVFNLLKHISGNATVQIRHNPYQRGSMTAPGLVRDLVVSFLPNTNKNYAVGFTSRPKMVVEPSHQQCCGRDALRRTNSHCQQAVYGFIVPLSAPSGTTGRGHPGTKDTVSPAKLTTYRYKTVTQFINT